MLRQGAIDLVNFNRNPSMKRPEFTRHLQFEKQLGGGDTPVALIDAYKVIRYKKKSTNLVIFLDGCWPPLAKLV